MRPLNSDLAKISYLIIGRQHSISVVGLLFTFATYIYTERRIKCLQKSKTFSRDLLIMF